jgi:hypothetical protein
MIRFCLNLLIFFAFKRVIHLQIAGPKQIANFDSNRFFQICDSIRPTESIRLAIRQMCATGYNVITSCFTGRFLFFLNFLRIPICNASNRYRYGLVFIHALDMNYGIHMRAPMLACSILFDHLDVQDNLFSSDVVFWFKAVSSMAFIAMARIDEILSMKMGKL